MIVDIYIIFSILLGFFIESIIGFGGTMISYALASLFVDIKEMIAIELYITFIASLFIILTDRKSIDFENLKSILLWNLPTVILGTFLLDMLHSTILLNIFGVFLLVVVWILISKPHVTSILEKPFLLINGLMQGIFGAGGPLLVASSKHKFKDKGSFRVTLAMFFLLFNLLRFLQYLYQGTYTIHEVTRLWWIFVPIFIVVYLGHQVHKKISEKYFLKGIYILLVLAGIFFILK